MDITQLKTQQQVKDNFKRLLNSLSLMINKELKMIEKDNTIYLQVDDKLLNLKDYNEEQLYSEIYDLINNNLPSYMSHLKDKDNSNKKTFAEHKKDFMDKGIKF